MPLRVVPAARRHRSAPGAAANLVMTRLWRMSEAKLVKVAAIAPDNRMARIVWAFIRTADSYRTAITYRLTKHAGRHRSVWRR